MLAALAGGQASEVLGFCGFYVAKAETTLFNKASQVVLVRDGQQMTVTAELQPWDVR